MNHTWPAIFLSDARTMGTGKVIGCEPPAPGKDDCPNCGGRGNMFAFYVDGAPPTKYPSGFYSKITKFIDGKYYTGEHRAQPCPVCAGYQKTVWLTKVSRLEGSDLAIRIDHFQPMHGKEAARDVAINLLTQTPYPYGFYTFYGEYGVGKTMLLKAVVNGFRVAEVTAAYTSMADLLAEVREQYGSDAKNAAETLIQDFRAVRVLAIDEIDRVNMTLWATETMFRLLNGRYEAQERMLTVLATNKGPNEMPEQLHYLASRMTEGLVVEVGGVDVRPGVSVATLTARKVEA